MPTIIRTGDTRERERERENIKFFIYEGKYARMFFYIQPSPKQGSTRVKGLQERERGREREREREREMPTSVKGLQETDRQTDTERDDQPLHKQRKLRLHYVHNFYSKRQCVNENVTRKPQEVEEDWPPPFFFRNIL